MGQGVESSRVPLWRYVALAVGVVEHGEVDELLILSDLDGRTTKKAWKEVDEPEIFEEARELSDTTLLLFVCEFLDITATIIVIEGKSGQFQSENHLHGGKIELPSHVVRSLHVEMTHRHVTKGPSEGDLVCNAKWQKFEQKVSDKGRDEGVNPSMSSTAEGQKSYRKYY